MGRKDSPTITARFGGGSMSIGRRQMLQDWADIADSWQASTLPPTTKTDDYRFQV